MTGRRPVLRLPRHRGTTAHACSLYPCTIPAGLGERGMYVGTNVLTGGGGWCWDPFESYAAGFSTNPNCWILGEPGFGKSALVKCLLYRMAAIYGTGPDGRFLALCDPKGEYRALAERLGLPVVRLAPGGTTRLNPLDAGSRPADDVDASEARVRHRAGIVTALAATVLGRPLTPLEDAAVFATVEHLDAATIAGRTVTLADVTALLGAPPPEIATALHRSAEEVTRDTEAARWALDKLLSRSLRGMFDGPSTVTIDWDGPGLVVDLSAVHTDPDALPLVMVAATGWLQALMTSGTRRQRVQVLDEAWCLLGNRQTAAFLQSSWKLGRTYGTANIAVAHRPSDLAAQADDGTSTAKIAAGLLADTATKIVLRQAPDQLAGVTDLLGLTRAEARVVGHLIRGRALWRVGARTAVVHHHLADGERPVVDTDQQMRATG